MPRRPYLRLLLAAALPLTAATTPSPQKILDAHLKAMGGPKLLAALRSQTLTGNLTEPATGKTGSFSLLVKAPNRFYLETVLEPDHEIAAFNGMSAWAEDATDGRRTLAGNSSRDAEALGRFWNGRLVDPKKDKLTLQVLGVEKIRNRDAYHLRVLFAPKVTRDVFFDTSTSLIVRESSPAGDVLDYDDFRPVNGIQTPHRIELRRGAHQYTIDITRAEYNSPVDDSVFAFPRTTTGPLPDVPELMRKVNTNQKALEALMQQYTCRVNEEEEQSDPDGTSKARSEYDLFYVGSKEVRHIVAKDGKLLSGNDKKKEDEHFAKEFAKAGKERAELAANPKKQQEQDEKTAANLSRLLQAWVFSNPRRERFRGHDVIAADFGPNPDHKPKGLNESFAHSLAGVLWIDEEALEIVRLEARFTEPVKVVGGVLASLEKGSNMTFEQAKVNDEVWLPVYTEFHIAGRLLFFHAKANVTNRYSDYKKFQANSKIVADEER